MDMATPLRCAKCGRTMAAVEMDGAAAYGTCLRLDAGGTVALCEACFLGFDNNLDKARRFFSEGPSSYV